MNLRELSAVHKDYLQRFHPYQMIRFDKYDYSILERNIIFRKKSGRGGNETVNDVIIAADTETSKKINSQDNHVCAWTISIRAYHYNVVTLYGSKPSDMVKCFKMIVDSLKGEETYIFFHNLAYDWVFLRKFLFKEFGFPIKQLNTKPHYPISITFGNGVILRDSLILAQRSLDKWAKDMNVEHQKALGNWDYNKIRNQNTRYTKKELIYIEHDTLALAECLDALIEQLHKHIFSIPYTATGIVREDIKKIGKANRARSAYKNMCMSYDEYLEAVQIFHGGFTHANRMFVEEFLEGLIECYDFGSSYPFVMLSEKYPMERFSSIKDRAICDILEYADKYAFMFKLVMIKPELIDHNDGMPALQFSKCVKVVNPLSDNGRIISAEYVEIYLNEIDLAVIEAKYTYESAICTEVKAAMKGYLPRWLTNYIYGLWCQKTRLKGGDPVAYAMSKGKVNSCYGMLVQKNIQEDIEEDYLTGGFIVGNENLDEKMLYEKYTNRVTAILPYQWGVWVTSYAFRNLFELGKCCELWLYSDTDSCYGVGWDEEKIKAYNNRCIEKLHQNGYEPIEFNGRLYSLGVAEFDGAYKEFRMLGAKRYAARDLDGKLKITVAGVPKKTGALCLKDNINNFTKGFVFDGKTTGKLSHFYNFIDEIYIDEDGNETGDSIDLQPCDYICDSVENIDFDRLFMTDIEVTYYG